MTFAKSVFLFLISLSILRLWKAACLPYLDKNKQLCLRIVIFDLKLHCVLLSYLGHMTCILLKLCSTFKISAVILSALVYNLKLSHLNVDLK